MSSKPQRVAPRTTTPLAGRATVDGTARLVARFASRFAPDFYRPLDDGLMVSSIGLGSYLGECDDADDDAYTETAHHALASGLNLLDTAINYRCQRSERALGRALSRAVRGGTVARDEVVVCTKGGYIPLDGAPPATREDYQEYLAREFFAPGIVAPADVVGGGHSLAPSFLAAQIDRSRANLGLEAIDVYYVHNPEQQLDVVAPAVLAERLRAAFALLEERCARGDIGVYGCATWNGLRTPPGARGHLELAELVAIAREVAGDAHHFRVVQLPVNLALAEAVRAPTQRLGEREVTLLEAAAQLGVSVVASATLFQAKLATNLPPAIRDAIPGLGTDAQRAIAFVRSLPVISSALVGMKSMSHLKENIGAGRR
ncbi:MAG TPA: aldo/keto reductase [Gemmatimonadaceae bacterium]|nr:aldo/keto reductase [Gemmatimonadaceae bacterium]